MKALILLLIAFPVLAQESDDGDKLLLVPKRYLSAEAIAHAAPPPVVEASKWIGLGKEIGEAMNQGLGAVVNQADRFGATKVGMFTMAAIAFKVAGQDAINLTFGLPIMFLGVLLWIWSLRHFFFDKRVLVKRVGLFGEREWQTHKYEFSTDNGRAACVGIHASFLAVWLIMWFFKIF